MALCKHPLGEIPIDTSALAKAAFRKKPHLYMAIADEFEDVFVSEDFEKLYPKAGQWGIHPARMACMLIVQALEGLSDRQLADKVRGDLPLKYLLRLPADHEGWDESVFCEARDRFVETQSSNLLLDLLLKKMRERNLLDARKQRTDSTHIIAASRSMNRFELAFEAVRNCIEDMMLVQPDWVMSIAKPVWLQRYYLERPFNYKLPKGEKERIERAEEVGHDGLYLLEQIDTHELKDSLNQLEPVVILRRVLDENFSNKGGKLRFRLNKDLKPSAERLASPHDTEARKGTKGSQSWLGFKAHFTETCVKGFPNLITNVETTAATVNDSEVLPRIHEKLISRELAPKQHLVDCGYVNVQTLAESKTKLGIDVVARLANGHTWQSKADKGFDNSRFAIDWERRTVVCPMGVSSETWKQREKGDASIINVSFPAEACGRCPVKEDCTKSDARKLQLKPRSIWEFMQFMRERQQTDQFWTEYACRAGVEGTQAQLVRSGIRRSRYRGLDKTHLANVLAATAVNLVRAVKFISGIPKATTRSGRYQSAAAAA